jgi:hypothetical protein
VLVLTDDEAKSVTLDCPDARDADETGGLFAVYRGAVWPEDETATVTCTLD